MYIPGLGLLTYFVLSQATDLTDLEMLLLGVPILFVIYGCVAFFRAGGLEIMGLAVRRLGSKLLAWVVFVWVGTYVLLQNIGGLTDEVRTFVAWFFEAAGAAPTFSLVAGVICFILAVLSGAFRQICSYLLLRTFPLVVTDQDGKEKIVRLGINPPAIWFSLTFRLLSWLFVAATSIWAGGIVAALLLSLLPTETLSGDFAIIFIFAMFLRWSISALLGVVITWDGAQTSEALI